MEQCFTNQWDFIVGEASRCDVTEIKTKQTTKCLVTWLLTKQQPEVDLRTLLCFFKCISIDFCFYISSRGEFKILRSRPEFRLDTWFLKHYLLVSHCSQISASCCYWSLWALVNLLHICQNKPQINDSFL